MNNVNRGLVPESAVHGKAFRSELVGLRRRMLDLSQAELAELTGTAQGTLSKIEQGLRESSEEITKRLAEALKCPVSFFYQTEREYGPPMSAHPMFRKKASVGQKVLDRVIAELNVRIAHVRTLLGTIDFAPELPLPQYHSDEFDGDMETVAANVRRAWYMPRGPIKSLTEYVERAGCLVIPCDMEAARIDGVSYRVPGVPPVIFLNRNQPADRMRFSLAHELGHLVLHSYPEPDMEQQANEFAAALLMPKEDIGSELAGLTFEKAAYMKPVWRASIASIIVRATTLKKIDQNKAMYLWRQMSSKGYRLREPPSLDFPAEQTSLIDALISNLVDGLGYSVAELESVLHLHYQELVTMYGLRSKASLHAVK